LPGNVAVPAALRSREQNRPRRCRVPLSESLPRPIEETLAAKNGGSADVVIAVAADLTRQVSFGEEWLVVTKDRLLVYEPNGTHPTPRFEVPLTDLKAPATDSLVGGAALHATINGETVELVRYTNARQRDFS